MLQDIRVACRQLMKQREWTVAIVLVLAVGIGANTAMFSAFEAWVLRPLDFHEPDRLVGLNETQPQLGREGISLSHLNLGDWLVRQSTMADVGMYQTLQMNLNDEDEPARLYAARVSANLFPLLGKDAIVGRHFLESEDNPGAPAAVVLISHTLWQERFSEDPRIIGRTIRLDNRSHEIVGVMEAHFAFPAWSDIWVPLGLDMYRDRGDRALHWLRAIGRLRDGIEVEAANAEIVSIADALAEEYPETNRGYSASVTPLRLEFVPPVIEVAMVASLVSALFVLLVICANVASLILAQAAARSRETAVRSALGASRGRLARAHIIEGVLVALPAGLLGAYFGVIGVRSMLAYVPVDPPYLFRMTFNAQAGIYTLAVSLLAGALCGLAPMLRSSGRRLYESLKTGGREGGGKEATRFRSVLLTGELALTTTLLVGALLMVKSFVALQAVDPGFRTDSIMTSELSLRGSGDDTSSVGSVRVAERMQATLSEMAGVESVGVSSHLPASDGYRVWGLVSRELETESAEDVQASVFAVLGDYFETIEIPLESGRLFTDIEQRQGGDVAIVSRALAQGLWPNRDPLGREIRVKRLTSAAWLTVVGVVDDIEVGRDMVSRDIPKAQLYVPYAQAPTSQVHVVSRSRASERDHAARVREAFAAAAPGVPFSEILTMEEAMFRVRWVSSFFSRQLLVYAILAMVVACVGIYGLTADAVARRTREIAVRIALGAGRSRMLLMILRDSLILGGAGVATGLVASAVLTSFMRSMFAGVSVRDPMLFVGVGASLLAVVTLASVLPARRASRLDPVTFLRTE